MSEVTERSDKAEDRRSLPRSLEGCYVDLVGHAKRQGSLLREHSEQQVTTRLLGKHEPVRSKARENTLRSGPTARPLCFHENGCLPIIGCLEESMQDVALINGGVEIENYAIEWLAARRQPRRTTI